MEGLTCLQAYASSSSSSRGDEAAANSPDSCDTVSGGGSALPSALHPPPEALHEAEQADGRPSKRPKSGIMDTDAGPSAARGPAPTSLPDPLALLAASNEDELLERAQVRGQVGRVRTFPHAVGSYPTVVYIPAGGAEQLLERAYHKVRRHVPDLQPAVAADAGADGGAGAPLPLPHHMSLSRTVAVRFHQIELLVAALQRALENAPRCAVTLSSRALVLGNDERTRTFVCLPVTQGADEVCRMVRRVDGAFARHQLQPFYEVPLPHVSVGWVLGDRRDELAAAVERSLGSAAEQAHTLEINNAICLIGKRPHVVWSGEPARQDPVAPKPDQP